MRWRSLVRRWLMLVHMLLFLNVFLFHFLGLLLMLLFQLPHFRFVGLLLHELLMFLILLLLKLLMFLLLLLVKLLLLLLVFLVPLGFGRVGRGGTSMDRKLIGMDGCVRFPIGRIVVRGRGGGCDAALVEGSGLGSGSDGRPAMVYGSAQLLIAARLLHVLSLGGDRRKVAFPSGGLFL